MYNMIPFGRVGSLNQFFDDMERSFFPREPRRPMPFRTDIRDRGDHILLEADLPGFDRENIDLEVKEGILTISARREEREEDQNEGGYLCRERRCDSVTRAFGLEGIQEDGITAAYENGVLKLTLPKVPEIQPQSRRIAIQ